ncbi:ABC transporter permease [Gorillibacterium timonense]|uniref:ABC transporter permease n=1 Tax=Gorillibacterium timonense TaxID=1689269 RepID=UPI00071CE8F3|nr:FtsX-like permease family protein [Gorillibacterium timonense]
MTFYERAFRYIQRKKSKSALLLSCFLIISIMILCATIVLQTAQATNHSIHEKMGTKLVLENQQGKNRMTIEMVSQLLNLTSVTKINRVASHIAYPANFSPIMLKEGTEKLNLAVTLHAYDNTEIDGPFAQEKYRLLAGVPITEKQDGILINSILAEANQLAIGDQLTFETETGGTVSGKVIGLFFSGMERKQENSIPSANRIENQIFVHHKLFQTLYGEGGYSSLIVYTDYPEKLVDLYQQVKLVMDNSTSMTTSDTLYRQMQAPLKQIIRMTTLMLALIVITAMIVISLLLWMWTRTRSKEIAVLISLGVSKINVLLQSLTESLALFALSVLGAAGCSEFLARRLLQGLFSTGDFSSMTNIHLEGQHLLTLLLLGSIIILVAVGLSIYPTLRANPGDTLSKMEG